MWSISKDFPFAASHQLLGLPEGHKCGRVHGHNYIARVTLTSPALDSTGFVLDYGKLAQFGRWLDENLDHRHLNDVLPCQPSAEQLARHLHGVARNLVPAPPGVTLMVAVSETPRTWAEYRDQ